MCKTNKQFDYKPSKDYDQPGSYQPWHKTQADQSLQYNRWVAKDPIFMHLALIRLNGCPLAALSDCWKQSKIDGIVTHMLIFQILKMLA